MFASEEFIKWLLMESVLNANIKRNKCFILESLLNVCILIIFLMFESE